MSVHRIVKEAQKSLPHSTRLKRRERSKLMMTSGLRISAMNGVAMPIALRMKTIAEMRQRRPKK